MLLTQKQSCILLLFYFRRLNHRKKLHTDAWMEYFLIRNLKIFDSRISFMNIVIRKVRKVCLTSVKHIKIECFACEIKTTLRLSRVCRLLSLYPIAGSENVFRYLDSPWGRVPDADFLRPATNHQSSPSPTTSTHPTAHKKKNKKNTALSLIASPARWVFFFFLYNILQYFNPLSRNLSLLWKYLNAWGDSFL